jgi:CheY-like chemotaxis protein
MGARILVADDSVTIQKVVELTCSKEDFQLIQARSGEEAIRKARAERPDLILLDLVMPDKTGYEVCETLRAEPMLQSVPIVLLAGTFESLDRERAAKAGATDFISKPFESQLLVGKVKQLLFARALNGGRRPSPLAVAPGPEAAGGTEASPVTPDQLWQLLEDSRPAAPPAAGEAAPLDLSALEEPGLDLELLSEQSPAGAADPGGAGRQARPVPGSLSLDELLGPETAAGPVASSDAPAFELPEEELPSLPLLEVEVERPPVEEVAELPGSALELEVLPGPPAGAVPPDAAAPADAEAPELDLGLEELSPEATPSDAAAPAEESGGVIALEDDTALASGAEEADVPASSVEAMRRAVTARVAEQLAKELSQKLTERIERAVWEVVPDLAEILITKEIERIRQLADEQQSS